MKNEEPEEPMVSSTQDIQAVSINEEMTRSYLDYAMSVIVARALPDVRDGLKPVHRRILYAMNDMGLLHNKSYRKSAAVIGEVMGKYHPHGDASIYDALVRMAQDFSLRDPLIDGQGNYGSIDADPPAAMRYTECRLEKISQMLLLDIDKNTVDFQENYDGREVEPKVLPARFPNLLVNGSGGIAVGMATNIPPHNLGEVLQACIALIDNPDISLEELMQFVPGPDFPTGALIMGRAGVRSAYQTGRGSVVMRAKVKIEDIRENRQAIIVSQMPYQVNKRTMIEKISELVRDKRVEGISAVRDESDRDGYRVVIELKRDAFAEVVLNQLYKYTPLQSNFSCNMVALNGGRPEQMNLTDILKAFVAFREEVVGRRTKYLLAKARERAHVLVGLAIAVANIDEIIALIRRAPDPQTARDELMQRRWPALDVAALIRLVDDPRHIIHEDETYNLSEAQARAILELRLQRLTALGRDEIAAELGIIGAEIKEYLAILASRPRILTLVKEELAAVGAELATPRRTEFSADETSMEDEDLIAKEDMVVTVSHGGYIKRVPLDSYRAQHRGGKGRIGMATKDDDYVSKLFMATTHSWLLFFSSHGMVYKEKVWRLPISTLQSRGKALINLLPLAQGELISFIMPLSEDEASWVDSYVMFTSTKATVRRNNLADLVPATRNGKRAMKLSGDEEIVAVALCEQDDDVLLISARGQCVRFPAIKIRLSKGRDSMGVRGINLKSGDRLISMAILKHVEATTQERAAYLKNMSAVRRADEDLPEQEYAGIELSEERFADLAQCEQKMLIISEYGYGKLVSSYDFTITNRGNMGVKAINSAKTEQTGYLIGAFVVELTDQVMVGTSGGQIIRVPVSDISLFSRMAKGVTIVKTAAKEKVMSVEVVPAAEPAAEPAEGEDAIEI